MNVSLSSIRKVNSPRHRRKEEFQMRNAELSNLWVDKVGHLLIVIRAYQLVETPSSHRENTV